MLEYYPIAGLENPQQHCRAKLLNLSPAGMEGSKTCRFRFLNLVATNYLFHRVIWMLILQIGQKISRVRGQPVGELEPIDVLNVSVGGILGHHVSGLAQESVDIQLHGRPDFDSRDWRGQLEGRVEIVGSSTVKKLHPNTVHVRDEKGNSTVIQERVIRQPINGGVEWKATLEVKIVDQVK